MFNMHSNKTILSNRNFACICLACFSLCGTIIGVTASCFADPLFFSMMRIASSSRVSIVDLLPAVLCPFLISFVVSFIGRSYLFFPLCFIKSMLYALNFAACHIAFASAGWLVSGFLLLTDSAVTLLLHWYWFRQIDSIKASAYSDLITVSALSIAVSIADQLWICPYLATLINS